MRVVLGFRSALGPWGGLLSLLVAAFLFNVGAAAWSAAVAGSLVHQGEHAEAIGSLYAVCDVLRLPAAILLPALTLRLGTRRVMQGGLLVLGALPLLALAGLGGTQLKVLFVGSALPMMAVYVGLPAFAMGAAGEGRDGRVLAWLGLAGSAAKGGRAFGGLTTARSGRTDAAIPALPA